MPPIDTSSSLSTTSPLTRRELRSSRRRRRTRLQLGIGASAIIVAVVGGGAAAVSPALFTPPTDEAAAAAAELAKDQRTAQRLLVQIGQQRADQTAVTALGRAETVIASAEGIADTGALRSSVAALGAYRTLDPDLVVTLAAHTEATAQSTAAAEAAARAAEAAAQEEARRLAVVNTPAGAREVAKELAASTYGWGAGELSCLNSLWQKESGWRYDAYNASSGATGIPQALPGSKMATAGSDWKTNARTQIIWGLSYIHRGYGTPCSAWSHSQSVNWY